MPDTNSNLIDTSGLEQAVDRACDTIDTLRAQRDELQDALKHAVRVIRIWHGLGAGNDEAQLWSLYQGSPEMTRINDVLARVEVRS